MKTRFSQSYHQLSVFLALASWPLASVALAAPTGSAGLPYEPKLTKIVDSFTGVVAWSIAAVCLLVALYQVAHRGGEVTGAVWALFGPTIVCTLLISIKAVMSFFGQGAVLIPAAHTTWMAANLALNMAMLGIAGWAVANKKTLHIKDLHLTLPCLFA